MKVISKINELRENLKVHRMKDENIGLVPTMGYFHEGHLSLMRKAREECDVVVVSLYVNPIQFGPKEDLKDYPRDLKRDAKLAEKEGVDYLFAPVDKEMYHDKLLTYVEVEKMTEVLCGRSRPGHFKGVITVVAKLFNIIQPDKAYFGQKDAQQLVVIKKMVEDLNFDIEIVACPTVREKDGLAMSSRNTYLRSEERNAALRLSEALAEAERLVREGERASDKIKQVLYENISSESLVDIEYIEVYDNNTLESLPEIKGDMLIALAARVGKARLIDNVVINKED